MIVNIRAYETFNHVGEVMVAYVHVYTEWPLGHLGGEHTIKWQQVGKAKRAWREPWR